MVNLILGKKEHWIYHLLCHMLFKCHNCDPHSMGFWYQKLVMHWNQHEGESIIVDPRFYNLRALRLLLCVRETLSPITCGENSYFRAFITLVKILTADSLRPSSWYVFCFVFLKRYPNYIFWMFLTLKYENVHYFLIFWVQGIKALFWVGGPLFDFLNYLSCTD